MHRVWTFKMLLKSVLCERSVGPPLMLQVRSLASLAYSLLALSPSTYQMPGPQLTPALCLPRIPPRSEAGFRIWATPRLSLLAAPLLLWGCSHGFGSPRGCNSAQTLPRDSDHCNFWGGLPGWCRFTPLCFYLPRPVCGLPPFLFSWRLC